MFEIRKSTGLAISAGLVALVIMTAIQRALSETGLSIGFVEFDVFYLVGQLAQSGAVETVYHALEFASLQAREPGQSGFMPYSYPPQTTLFTIGLAVLPSWLAYGLFAGVPLVVFVFALYRIDPDRAGLALVLTLPAVLLTIRCGQNGTLTAALIGLFCLWWGHRFASGLPLGLMTCKPHLGIGIALAVLFRLRHRLGVVAVAAVLTGAAAAVATIVFGPDIWAAFLSGARESTLILEQDGFPLYRMVSVYAVLRTAGFDAATAMWLHLVFAAGVMAYVGQACLAGIDGRPMLALSIMGGLFISPYLYDYDLCVLAVVITLVGPELARMSGKMQVLLISGALASTTSGPAQAVAWFEEGTAIPGGLGLIIVGGVIAYSLQQRSVSRPAPRGPISRRSPCPRPWARACRSRSKALPATDLLRDC